MNKLTLRIASLNIVIALLLFTGACSSSNVRKDASALNPKNSRQVEAEGVTFHLKNCVRVDKSVDCHLTITSHFIDRTLEIYMNRKLAPLMIRDDVGNIYTKPDIVIGNKHASEETWKMHVPLVSAIPTRAIVHFKNISSQASSISTLELNGNLMKNGRKKGVKVEFNEIPLSASNVRRSTVSMNGTR